MIGYPCNSVPDPKGLVRNRVQSTSLFSARKTQSCFFFIFRLSAPVFKRRRVTP